MLTIALLTLVCVVTYTFEIIFGLAGTIMMVMVMTYFIDTKTLVIYSILPQIMVGTIGLVRSPKTVRLGYLARMVAFASVGGIAGLSIFYYLSTSSFHTLLASAITLFGTYLVLRPGQFRLNAPVRYGLDIAAGASQALFGISGPIAMTRLLGTFKEKLVIRNYALAFFLSMNVFRGVGYLANNTFTPEITYMMVVSGPFIALALWYSNHLHLHVNERVFRTVVAWIILVGGISMFFNSPGPNT